MKKTFLMVGALVLGACGAAPEVEPVDHDQQASIGANGVRKGSVCLGTPFPGYSQFSSDEKRRISWAMGVWNDVLIQSGNYPSTRVKLFHWGSTSECGAFGTEAIWMYKYTSADGITWADTIVSGSNGYTTMRIDTGKLAAFEDGYQNSASRYLDRLWSVAAHEFGHTLALQHVAGVGIMHAPLPPFLVCPQWADKAEFCRVWGCDPNAWQPSCVGQF